MENGNNSDSVALKTYSNNDERLRQVGTILATPKSRLIYGMLIEKEYHAREIAKIIEETPNPHLPIVKFHLNKMVESGLVTVKIRRQRKNGKHLKFYRAVPFLLIVPSIHLEKTQKNKTLHKLFKNLSKTLFVIVGIYSWICSETSFFWRRIVSAKYNIHYY